MNAKCIPPVILGLALTCATVMAQMPPGMTMTPMEPPAELKGAIPLYKGVAPGSENDKQKEKWAKVRDDYVARNVTSPTLTPFLPTKERATGAAVIVAPGGGFMVLSMKNEGIDVARYLSDRGIAAFVLKYRIRAHARERSGDAGRHEQDDGWRRSATAGGSASSVSATTRTRRCSSRSETSQKPRGRMVGRSEARRHDRIFRRSDEHAGHRTSQ